MGANETSVVRTYDMVVQTANNLKQNMTDVCLVLIWQTAAVPQLQYDPLPGTDVPGAQQYKSHNPVLVLVQCAACIHHTPRAVPGSTYPPMYQV